MVRSNSNDAEDPSARALSEVYRTVFHYSPHNYVNLSKLKQAEVSSSVVGLFGRDSGIYGCVWPISWALLGISLSILVVDMGVQCGTEHRSPFCYLLLLTITYGYFVLLTARSYSVGPSICTEYAVLSVIMVNSAGIVRMNLSSCCFPSSRGYDMPGLRRRNAHL